MALALEIVRAGSGTEAGPCREIRRARAAAGASVKCSRHELRSPSLVGSERLLDGCEVLKLARVRLSEATAVPGTWCLFSLGCVKSYGCQQHTICEF